MNIHWNCLFILTLSFCRCSLFFFRSIDSQLEATRMLIPRHYWAIHWIHIIIHIWYSWICIHNKWCVWEKPSNAYMKTKCMSNPTEAPLWKRLHVYYFICVLMCFYKLSICMNTHTHMQNKCTNKWNIFMYTYLWCTKTKEHLNILNI